MGRSFGLYRILGNDLPPLHGENQTEANLRFILENEPELEGAEKIWILNRLVSRPRQSALEGLLRERGHATIVIPFDERRYRSIGADPVPDAAPERRARMSPAARELYELRGYAARVRYVMNVNAARNAAIEHGRGRYDVLLPWDGNVFVTPDAWRTLARDAPHATPFVVPMARVDRNDELLRPGFVPAATEEPQLGLPGASPHRFDEQFPYGYRDKVELLVRLGVAGPWDSWPDDPRYLPFRRPRAPFAHVARVAWVARLSTGTRAPPLSLADRAAQRRRATRDFVDSLDHPWSTRMSGG